MRYLSESSVIHAIGDIHPLDYNGQGIVERIKAIHAADVRPVVRGEWEVVDQEEPRTYGCSACKKLARYPHLYCPNCGADMREVDT